MLIPKGDGTFVAGPLDVICILKGPQGRFHPAFFEEHAFPGVPSAPEDVKVVRLVSRMHHTEGAATLEIALMQVAELVKKISVLPTNIWLKPTEWDGSHGVIWICDNWLKQPPKAYNNLEAALKNPQALLAELKN